MLGTPLRRGRGLLWGWETDFRGGPFEGHMARGRDFLPTRPAGSDRSEETYCAQLAGEAGGALALSHHVVL